MHFGFDYGLIVRVIRMMQCQNWKYIFHLTAFKNMESILRNGLLPRNQLDRGTFIDVADSNIIGYREENDLNGYIPFHFFHPTPFAGAVMKKYPGTYVYIAVSRKYAAEHNFEIIPVHPMSEDEKYQIRKYPYVEGFNLIDWDTMNKRDYHDPHCKEVCMAECLCKGKLDLHQLIRSEDALFFTRSNVEKEKLNQLYQQVFNGEDAQWRIIVVNPPYRF